MRKFGYKSFYFLLSLIFASAVAYGVNDFESILATQWVKIGGTSAANSSAALEINSTTKGLLFSRMTEVQRDAISSPAEGLMIYNTDTDKFNGYNGVAWGEIGGGISLPGSSTDNAVVLWNGTGGATLKNSGFIISSDTVTTGIWSGTAIGATRGGTGATTVATGDLLYGSASNVWSKLGAGTSGKALVQGASIPSWTTLGATGGGTGLTSATTGDVIYASGTDTWAKLAAGTSGKVLVQGASIPSWTTLGVSGGGTGIASGTSGGIPYFSGTGTIASSALLTANQLIVGGGAATTPVSLAAGATDTVLRISGGVPGYSATLANLTLNTVTANGGIWDASSGGVIGATNYIELPRGTAAQIAAVTTAGGVGYSTDTNSLYVNDGSKWSELGDKTNEQREYIKNGTFEGDAAGWNTYADAAASSPVDCTGGSPASTGARTTTSGEVLRGTASYELAKSAANRQGEGASFDFTIDPREYKSRSPVYISFDYGASSTNFASGDVKVFVYDKDATTLLGVQDVSSLAGALPYAASSTGGTRFTGVFYPTTTTSDDYRVCFHIATTNATAYDFHLDSVHFGPSIQTPGAIEADYGTESWVDSEGNSTTSVKLTRKGQWLFVEGISTASGVFSGSQFTVTVPAAYTFDSAVYPSPATKIHEVGGGWFVNNASSTYVEALVATQATSTLFIGARNSSSTYTAVTNVTSTIPFTWASGDKIMWNAKWRVTGWQASAALSANEMLLSTVKAMYSTDAAQTFGNGSLNIVNFEDKVYDTHNAVTIGASWVFTAPKTAYYAIKSSLMWQSSSAWAVNESTGIEITKNTSTTWSAAQYVAQGTLNTFLMDGPVISTVLLTKGDTVSIRAFQSSGGNLNLHNAGSYNYVNIEEQPDFSIFSQYNTVDRQYSCTFSGPAGYSMNGTAKCLPYLTADGAWRMRFNIDFSLTSATSITLVPPFTCKAGMYQALAAASISSNQTINYCRCDDGAATITCSLASGTTRLIISGDVELNAKPSMVP